MPDLRVIDGGGPRPPDDHNVRLAVQALRYLLIELLRAVARGNDSERRVTGQLIELYRHLGGAGIKVDTVVEGVLGEVSSALTRATNSDRELDNPDQEIEDILLASFQVAAERLCLDDAAQGRTSQRMRRLDDRLEAWLLNSERRSRQHGWSYIEQFVKSNLPKPRHQKGGPPTKREEQPGFASKIVPNGREPRKSGFDAHCAEAYERFSRGEIQWDQLPVGRYPNGMRIYADGEWEALVRAAPMQKREIAALGAFFKSKGTIGYVKGAGLATTERLAARGYVEIVQDNGKGILPFYGITPAGEAAWEQLARK